MHRSILKTLLLTCFTLTPLLAIRDWAPAGYNNASPYMAPVEVQSVDAGAGSITFKLWETDFAYEVYRKAPEDTSWGTAIDTVNAGIDSWTDNSAMVGTLYEYRFHVTNGQSDYINGYILAGIEVDRTGDRGHAIVVMPSSLGGSLSAEIAQFKQDLRGDGWQVHEVLTVDGESNFTNDPATATTSSQIRSDIQAVYGTLPANEPKQLVLLGRVPLARSGVRASWAPDGHSDLGANAADCYYADMDGTWTDTGDNSGQPVGGNSGETRSQWVNVPGDGRFDQVHLKEFPDSTPLEMGWGRIDFRNNTVSVEEDAIRTYLAKLHDYKHVKNGFSAGLKAGVRDAGALFKHVDEHLWRDLAPVVGLSNLSYADGNDMPTTGDGSQPEAEYTFQNGPFLFFLVSGTDINSPSPQNRAVFQTCMKSHIPYFDFSSTMRNRVSEAGSWTLSMTSIQTRNHYVYHKMGMGGTMGDVMMSTMNSTDMLDGIYGTQSFYKFNGPWTTFAGGASHGSVTTLDYSVSDPETDGVESGRNDYQSYVYNSHIGDPTLRAFMIRSVSDLTGTIINSGTEIQLDWTASADASEGYHVYRSASLDGSYSRLTTSPVSAGVTSGPVAYVDTAPLTGNSFYMVRAVKLETTAGGTFFNASTGLFVEVDPTPPPVATISAPTAGQHNAGQSLSFSGTVIDLEDGDLTASATWTSDIDGLIGNGGSFSRSDLSVGTHTITLSATDTDLQVGSAQLQITILAPGFLTADFSGTDISASTPWTAVTAQASNMSYSGLSLGAGHNASGSGQGPSVSNTFAFWATSYGSVRTTIADAVSNDHYLSFTLTADSGYALNLNNASIELKVARTGDGSTGWNAANHVALMSSQNGFADGSELDSMQIATGYSDYNEYTITLNFPTSGYSEVSGPLEIRLYFYDGQWSTVQQISLNALEMTGFVTSTTGSTGYDLWSGGISWSGADNSLGADPDADGVENLLEYALLMDPLTNSLDQLPTVGQESDGGQDYITIRWRENLDASDLTYSLESTTNITGTWTDYTPAPADVSELSNNGTLREMQARIAVNPGEEVFLRVKVEK